MVADGMAFPQHSFIHAYSFKGTVAEDKEGCLYPVIPQLIQDCFRIARGAIVKSQISYFNKPVLRRIDSMCFARFV
jgi:hypothetical protein